MNNRTFSLIYTIASIALGCVLTTGQLHGFPQWWIEKGVTSSDPEGVDNLAVANIGQLKHFASKARDHLDDFLPGGAGQAIDEMVDGFATFDPNKPWANYSVVNIGQVKNVAEKFYLRLEEVGYVGSGFKTGSRPWDPDTPVKGNYTIACTGQLKNVFSFDVSAGEFDSDGDGVLDCFQVENPVELAGPMHTHRLSRSEL